jgi:signal transduction histidine kinase
VGETEKVNILLVDDQPARLLTYESILGPLEHNLVKASSGLEALDKLLKDEFAVVLLDVSMPEMDGFEVAKLIHQHPRFEKTPIIFVTGVNVSELDRLRGYQLGAIDYVSIPVVPEILRGKVAVLVELYCKRRDLQTLNRTLASTNTQLEQTNVTLQGERAREFERVNQVLQEANAELAAANRHKDEFLAMLAHELRNPLQTIHNAIHLMRSTPSEDARRLTRAQDIAERQLAHLTRLGDDLLDVSRVTLDKIQLTREVVDLAALVARAVETIQPLIDERGHELTVDLPQGRLTVLGDPVRLTQALANVLTNAAKYTDPGGRIWISASLERATEIEIRVRDTGIGIPTELLPVVFELFTQLNRASDRTQGGMGIGLALVRSLVAMHGGERERAQRRPRAGQRVCASLAAVHGGRARVGRYAVIGNATDNVIASINLSAASPRGAHHRYPPIQNRLAAAAPLKCHAAHVFAETMGPYFS